MTPEVFTVHSVWKQWSSEMLALVHHIEPAAITAIPTEQRDHQRQDY
jgi:hypothetical protein